MLHVLTFNLFRILRLPLTFAGTVHSGCCVKTKGMKTVAIFFTLGDQNVIAVTLACEIKTVRDSCTIVDPAAFSVGPAPAPLRGIWGSYFLRNEITVSVII